MAVGYQQPWVEARAILGPPWPSMYDHHLGYDSPMAYPRHPQPPKTDTLQPRILPIYNGLLQITKTTEWGDPSNVMIKLNVN